MIICYYSAERYKRTKNGKVSKYFSKNTTREEIDTFINKQKKINKEFKMIKPFKLHLDKNTGNSTVLIGSSKVGKSTLMMHIYNIYYSKSKFITTLYTSNPQSFGGFDKINRNLIIHKDIEEKVIKGQKLINEECNNKYNFVNMFDDILTLNRKTLINNLVLTYRNSMMSTVICMQYSNLLSKMSRANFNNVIMHQLLTDEAIEVVIKTFLRSNLKKRLKTNNLQDMIQWYKKNTNDHKFLYYRPDLDELTIHKLLI